MGNFLNGGTFNANAPGFKIDALGKVIIDKTTTAYFHFSLLIPKPM